MRSILLIKTSSLGDVIHNLPVVSDLRRLWPEVRIDWVVEESFAEIPRMHPGVAEVIPVGLRRWRGQLTRRHTWRQMMAFRQQLRRRCYDLVVDTQGLIKSAVLTRLADGLRCGYAAEVAREPLAARCYDQTYAIPRNAHAVERNRWLAAAACGYAPDLPLRYGLRAGELRPSWVPDEPYCVLLTATSRDDKLWPEAEWIALGRVLASQGLRCVLPAGNAVERARAARLATEIADAVCAPPATLAELAGVLAGANAVIGVDTGLTHLAAALDRPTIALFIASDPGLTGVFAGARAINLGARGAAPRASEVLAQLDALRR